MSDYISREAAIAYIRDQSEELQKAFEELGGESGIYADAYNDLAEDFHRIPAADVEPVVRCRECKFWEPYGSKAARKIGDPLERYGGCEIWHGGHLESDFCSNGQAHTNSTPLNQQER